MENSLNSVLSVGQVCTYVKQIFDSEEMLHNIVVSGEVSNLKTVGGYLYFNLKDQDGVLSCACFGLQKCDLPKDGDQVFVSGSLSFYAKGGRLSFIVSSITKAGLGSWMVLYRKLIEKLDEEGLFDSDRKKSIPKFPKKVCVVTSKTGAVIRDIVSTIRAKNKSIDIVVVDVRVQGEGAVSDIVNGLKLADESKSDVVILARGGGSWEDLLPFCDERVARAVYAMKTPVVSAVGHETDTTLVDYVADVRVPTPTAAGELVGYSESDKMRLVQSYLRRIKIEVEEKFTGREKASISLCKAIYSETGNRLNNVSNKLKLLTYKTTTSIDKKFIKADSELGRVADKISFNNPMNVLKKGLFKMSASGKTITDKDQIKKGDVVRLDSVEFVVTAEVKEVKEKGEAKGENRRSS